MIPNSLTATEQGAALDRLQLCSSFLLAALPAGELNRYAALTLGGDGACSFFVKVNY
jgi:hypothetical protein